MPIELYTIILLNYGNRATNKTNIADIVRKYLNIQHQQAIEIIDKVPCVLGVIPSVDIAFTIKKEIEIVGGKVNIIKMNQNNDYEFVDYSTVANIFSHRSTITHDSDNSNYDNLSSGNADKQFQNKNISSIFQPSDEYENTTTFEAPDKQKGIPSFMTPDQQGGAPSFKTPDQQGSAPSFRTPDQQEGAPSFRTPDQQEGAPSFRTPDQQGGAPSFRTPQQQNVVNSTNTVTRHSDDGSCFYHPNNIAVTKCDNCGRPICASCREVGELEDGQHVCFDCASTIVEADISIAKEKRSAILIKIGLGVLGAIIFGVIASTSGFKSFWNNGGSTSTFTYQLMFTLFGASLSIYFPILKGIIKWSWRFIRWKPKSKLNAILDFLLTAIKILVFIFAFAAFITVFSTFLFFSPLVASIIGIVDFIRYKKATNLVKRNQEILQHLADRMEYIRIQSEENIDNEALANDARMQDNQFAQAVRRNGYANATKAFSDEAQEMAENDKKIKNFIMNESGELVRAA